MEPWKYNVGVPQVSCAGPILWLLIANEALNKFGVDTEVEVQAFANDFVELLGSTASYHFSQIRTSGLAKLEKWVVDFSHENPNLLCLFTEEILFKKLCIGQFEIMYRKI
ncbi:hypothetical protein AVEN_241993-1 [Araneus ventricosus]|uniref:Reverse transcriptase domain-containing protein n=1 Tax=Araneus ventricosus TaxID=182803 RepID=A0A4Y2E9W2_ARAVE|nr:hypothetical protein AVEN_241993-1 [Araneus ventricosus]